MDYKPIGLSQMSNTPEHNLIFNAVKSALDEVGLILTNVQKNNIATGCCYPIKRIVKN